ncbi:MAG: hypothetical protein ABH804_03050 [archaeon]
MVKDRKRLTIILLTAVIVLLLIILVYLVIVKPYFKNYVLNLQMESYNAGIEDFVSAMMDYSEKCQQIPLFYYNKTVNLISIDCLG